MLSGVTVVHYEIAFLLISAPIIILFMIQLREYYAGDAEETIKRTTFVLGLVWLESFSQLFTESWRVYKLWGISLPPVHLIAEIVVFGYLAATLWDMWWTRLDQ